MQSLGAGGAGADETVVAERLDSRVADHLVLAALLVLVHQRRGAANAKSLELRGAGGLAWLQLRAGRGIWVPTARG